MSSNVCFASTAVLVLLTAAVAAEDRYFTIKVVDEQTGRGVPLVELQTVNDIHLQTDSAGIAAFYEPGLMDRRVFFGVESHGYEFAEDAFGFRGTTLHTQPGGSATLKIKRTNLAERLYRITGGGIYRDSVLVGQPVPIREPVLNAKVLGSDSVMSVVYGGQLWWFWGDTNRPSHRLGNFHVPGATSKLPDKGGLDPAQGADLNYFVDDDGFAKETAKMPGHGPTWISGLLTVNDDDGRARMFTGYAKIDPPLDVYERGLVGWNDKRQEFEHVVTFPSEAPLFPQGHTFHHEAEGKNYIYFADPFPLVRVRARAEDLRDASRYEAFTCLEPGSGLDSPQVDRDDHGRLRYGWKRDTPAVGPQQQRELVEQGHLEPHDGLLQLRDVQTGQPVLAHAGSVYFNPYRRRWVMVATELGGTSMLGEVWYAEADTPLGPWAYAVKVVTHDQYSFYNPKHHPAFDQQGGRIIYFEGTYTHTFSGNDEPTPRYDYNQLMYRLDLADPQTALPAAFTVSADHLPSRLTFEATGEGVEWKRIEMFALDRAGVDTVPVYLGEDQDGHQRLRVDMDERQRDEPLFHALPADSEPLPEAVVPLWEFQDRRSGAFAYSTDAEPPADGFVRRDTPLCFVWPNPRERDEGVGNGK